jgi:hypothetical protein
MIGWYSKLLGRLPGELVLCCIYGYHLFANVVWDLPTTNTGRFCKTVGFVEKVQILTYEGENKGDGQ